LHNGVLDPDGLISSIAAIAQGESANEQATALERLWDASKSGDTAAIERALAGGADIEAGHAQEQERPSRTELGGSERSRGRDPSADRARRGAQCREQDRLHRCTMPRSRVP
jgi:hypothetical protein